MYRFRYILLPVQVSIFKALSLHDYPVASGSMHNILVVPSNHHLYLGEYDFQPCLIHWPSLGKPLSIATLLMKDQVDHKQCAVLTGQALVQDISCSICMTSLFLGLVATEDFRTDLLLNV